MVPAWTGVYRQRDHDSRASRVPADNDLINENHPGDNNDASCIHNHNYRSAITSPEYQAVGAHRDNAFEGLNIMLAATPPAG